MPKYLLGASVVNATHQIQEITMIDDIIANESVQNSTNYSPPYTPPYSSDSCNWENIEDNQIHQQDLPSNAGLNWNYNVGICGMLQNHHIDPKYRMYF